ncbi:NlpC/P60 family protein [Streptomyces sp. SID3212]|uniref:C40 family peptidase n=1 Tax=Streptomyces sp. SID3212 TaxID=2690259 RepID=UPI00136A5BF4|nr:NlpC/P60 family protein [Streptomyces sp. SID3212]MYV58013.1 hydrolase [Streptomyces sp. SID3212]
MLALGFMIAGTIPADAATPKQNALTYARKQMGDRYSQVNPQGPNHWDCSGLMQAAYKSAGKSLPRVAQAQYNATKHIALSAAQPGDLLFFGRDSKHITHVGIFTGYKNGKGYMVNANTGSYRGRKVVEAPTSEYRIGGNKEFAGVVK